MFYFTKYAQQKFDLLNKHNVFITKEQVEDCLKNPEQLKKREKYFFASKENLRVVYQKEGNLVRVITFYPIK